MGLGVLEDRHLDNVPGTALLTDIVGVDSHHHDGNLDTSMLRHGTGKNADVVLVPQPSQSPNDPLNWPLWKKDLMLFIICVDTAVVGAWGPMIGPAYTEMTKEFNMSYNALNSGLGWGIFVIGISCFFTNPAAVIWGRRPIYLGANLLLFIGSLWGYFAHSYGSLLAARLVGCVGMSPFEILVTTTIADLYYVHQRGTRLAAWGLSLSIGVGGGTIISGHIIENLGWNWTYGISAIIFGVWMVVLFFFCPETAYRRDEALNIDISSEDKATEMRIEEVKHDGTATHSSMEHGNSNSTLPEEKFSYRHDLRIWNGRISDDAYWKVFTRPLMMLIFPQVLFSFIAYGLTSSWLIVVGSVLSQVFTKQYNFSVSGVGNIAAASLIGSIFSAVISGPGADYVAKSMSRRNNGVYEPEFRLVIIIVTLILGGMSFFGFGWSLSIGDPWIVPVIFYGFQYFSVGFMSIAVYGYLTDCHRDKAPEAFAAINLRNIYTFGMNYFISAWIDNQGPKKVFNTIGGVHVVICLVTIPMYIYGKRCRSWTARKKIFQTVMGV